MKNVTDALAGLQRPHQLALRWFAERAGQVVPWTSADIIDGTKVQLATRAQGIYKPAGSHYALSVKHTLSTGYRDFEPVFRTDGTWLYVYHQESKDLSARDNLDTNRALLNCWKDEVPVGVIIQTQPKPNVRYQVLGLALVARWDEGYFYLEGFGSDNQARCGEDYLLRDSLRLGQLATIRESGFDPAVVAGAREKILREITVRRGQAAFRASLVEAYRACCAMSGCDAIPALEAAHIVPYNEQGKSAVSNGLLLRADLHTLFDLHLISVDPQSNRVLIANELKSTTYRDLDHAVLSLPTRLDCRPSPANLAAHRTFAKL